ncbi:hypothetical protein H8356DRAFT_961559, partial [Neocallimastix lanati (nom. inval.)]
KNNNKNNNDLDYSARSSVKPDYFKDSLIRSNNPIPKTVFLTQDGPEYERFESKAEISNFRTREGLKKTLIVFR